MGERLGDASAEDEAPSEDHAPEHSELVFALVAAVGTDIKKVADVLATELGTYAYAHTVSRLSDFLHEDGGAAPSNFRDEALWDSMTAGDSLRGRWDRDDALALHAISDIVATRHERACGEVRTDGGENSFPAQLDRHAFILRSLKTPDELETLRVVYGPRLVVIGAYSPRDLRTEQLAIEIKDSRHESDRKKWARQPEELIDRDEKEELKGGQDVSGTFHKADFFIRADSAKRIEEGIARTLAILFGDPFRTPTRDETGQFHASGAALRSSELGRQVGAAILNGDGSVLAVGANEVPTGGGGSHWEELGVGNRDFEVSEKDTNRIYLDKLVASLAGGVANELSDMDVGNEIAGTPQATAAHVDQIREELIAKLPAILRQEGVKDLTEFGRAVHAEMNALLDAARRGVAVRGATLYSTTFPCHNCARHLIGAGITRVVFVEPYTKSKALDLHSDSITAESGDKDDKRVVFEPFVGVAPRRYLEMFDAAWRERLGHLARKDSSGTKQTLDKSVALPVLVDASPAKLRLALPSYRAKELLALDHFSRLKEDDRATE